MLSNFKPSKAPVLDTKIESHLAKIGPSKDGPLLYYPCSANLKTGESLDRVCLVEAQSFSHMWGDTSRRFLGADQLASIQASPDRLPAQLANKLYRAGESGMGYTLFQLQYADSSVSSHSTGNFVDFVRLPKGTSMNEVVDVIPHGGRNSLSRLSQPDHVWCPFNIA